MWLGMRFLFSSRNKSAIVRLRVTLFMSNAITSVIINASLMLFRALTSIARRCGSIGGRRLSTCFCC